MAKAMAQYRRQTGQTGEAGVIGIERRRGRVFSGTIGSEKQSVLETLNGDAYSEKG
jgi:hypothetical protein